MEKKKKSTGLKTKFWIGLAAVFMAGTFGGCTLAIPEAGLDGGGDRLIGAFITSEYLDLYDMEGYLNDHASKLSEGETITVGKDNKYEGKLLATVDKSQGDSSSEWKITFGEIQGQYILMPVYTDEYGTNVGNLCSPGISSPFLHYNVTDDEEEKEISGTVYTVPDGKQDQTWYVNPVYQTENDEIYAMTGNGYAANGASSEGDNMSATLTAESSVTENGKTQTEKCKVTVQFATMYKPVRTIIYQVTSSNQVLKQTAYKPSTVPDTLKVEPEAAYILTEIRKETPSGKLAISRYILNLESAEEEEIQYLEIWYPVENGLVSKKEIEIVKENPDHTDRNTDADKGKSEDSASDGVDMEPSYNKNL